MLDTHQLNVFLIAAETLSFTQTAKRLHLSQPSVSQHIQNLEKTFGLPLFIRKGRHLDLTDAGKLLVPLARDMVRLSVNITETMNSLKGEVYGQLMVGCSTTPGKYVLPLLLAEFHQKYPKVQVTCKVTEQGLSLKMLTEGHIHLSLTSSPPSSCSNAEFHSFMRDSVALIAPIDHPWSQKEEITTDELYHGRFIMREPDAGTYCAVEKALKDIGISITNLNTILTLGNSEAIALSVQEGVGVGFVSKLVVTKLCNARVRQIRIKNLNIFQDIYIGYQTRYPASSAQLAFKKMLEDMTHNEFKDKIEGSLIQELAYN